MPRSCPTGSFKKSLGVMKWLSTVNSLTLKSLAAKLGVKHNTAIRSMQDLEELGLVQRTSNHTWESLVDQFDVLNPVGPVFKRARLSEEDKKGMAARLQDGERADDLSIEYGCALGTVYHATRKYR